MNPLQRAYAAAKARGYHEAFEAYSELAASGSPNAWTNLGHVHRFGLGVPTDFVEAEKCYRKAIELGDVDANHRLARPLIKKGDYEGAFTLFFPVPQPKGIFHRFIGWAPLILKAKAPTKNYEKAEHYLKQAADRGHVFARRDYSFARLRGMFGKREALSGSVGSLLAVFAGVREIVRHPHGNERLR